MLTYRVGAVGASSGVLLAKYYQASDHLPSVKDGLASYYAKSEAEESRTSLAVPDAKMHPLVANRLGIDPTRPLTTQELANVLSGARVDGQPIENKRKTPNTFIDMTFSTPKSLSLAIVFARTDSERILLDKAHTDAVAEIMQHIAKQIGTASVGNTAHNRARNREPGHIAAIMVEHYTARPTAKIAVGNDTRLEYLGKADMQRHTHVLIPNICVSNESRATALYQDGLSQSIHEFGALFQAILSRNLRQLGVNVELDSTPGLAFHERMARLTDVPRWICDVFSKRHREGDSAFRDLAKDMGVDLDKITTEEKIEWIGRAINDQRKAKEKSGGEYASWMQQAKDVGYEHRSVLRPDSKQELRPAAERHKHAYDVSLPMIESQLENRAVIEGSVPRIAAAKGLIAAGISSADEVNAITAAYRTEGVKQDGTMTSVHWAFDTEKKYARVTTQLSVELEQEAISLLRTAAADKSVAVSPEAIKRATEKVISEAAKQGKTIDFTTPHGQKQLEFAAKIASSGAASVGIGVAGSGKSLSLRIPITAWHEAGRETMGITLAWRQTEGLNDAGVGRGKRKWEPNDDVLTDAGIAADKTFSLAMFLSKIEKGKIRPDRNTTVLVDEVGLLGTKDILDLARLQAKHGFQLVKIGDDYQCASIRAGAPIDLCRRAYGSENIPELLSSIRQETQREIDTTLMWRAGLADQALARKEEDGTLRVVPGGYQEAIEATVDLWQERVNANAHDSKYTIGISVPTNANGRAIGELIHQRRQAAGEIGADICEIDATDQNNERYSLRLAKGDRVRLFDRVIGTSGVVGNNGSVVEIVGADDHALTVRTKNGKTAAVAWDNLRPDAYERRQRAREGLPPLSREGVPVRLARGDAVTINARQSETVVEHVTSMPAGSAAVNGFNIYTSDSRHQRRSWIVTSQGAEKQELVNRRSLGDPANRETDPAKVKADILQNMSRNLSRQPKKTLALDFLDHAAGLRSGTIDARLAAWFRQETRQAEDKPPLAVAAKPSANSQPMTPDDWRRAMEEPASVKSTLETPQETKPQMSAVEVQAEFARVLEMEGFRLKGAPVMDGKWHRVAVDGDKGAQKSGSYRGWDTGGIHNKFRGGEPVVWRPDGVAATMTPAERDAQRASDMRERLADQAERNAREEKVANDAAVAWKASKPAHPKHAYLVRKQIAPHGLRQGAAGQVVPMTDGKEMKIGGKLIVPLRDVEGNLWNIQIIGQDGSKIFLPGRKRGLSATIGPMTPTGPVMIAEGFASAVTLYNTTSLTSVAAIDSGNLLAVAASIRAKYPEKPIIFGADNDHHLPKRTPAIPNVGIEKATEAAAQVGGVVIAPKFQPDDKSTDWNDVHVTMGEAAARSAIEATFSAQGISNLLPAQAHPQPPKQITQADRDAAWAHAKPRVSRKPTAPTSAVRETQKPTHTPGG